MIALIKTHNCIMILGGQLRRGPQPSFTITFSTIPLFSHFPAPSHFPLIPAAY